jgi:hypothetical protein
MVDRAKVMKTQGYSNADIAEAMGITEHYVRNLVPEEINWGYNCLTGGIHHGRPEAIWNLSLIQTTYMFTPRQFQVLAVDRIYSDALQLVDHGGGSFTKLWADNIKDQASPLILNVYRKKIGEITKYYRSLQFKQDFDEAIRLNQMGKLNPNYQPLHSHDSINMLCRIVGVSCATEASKE